MVIVSPIYRGHSALLCCSLCTVQRFQGAFALEISEIGSHPRLIQEISHGPWIKPGRRRKGLVCAIS